jgi:putative flippase GtrA
VTPAEPAQGQGHNALTTLTQIARFAGVGLFATLVHVTVALGAAHAFALTAMLANLAGFCAAFLISLLGHASFTFRVGAPTARHLRRFLTLSVLSLALSSLITAIASRFGATLGQAMLCVAFIVPAVSFIGARFWAFSQQAQVLEQPRASS